MKYVLFLIIILLSNSAYAQNCTTEFLLQKPGTWKLGRPGSVIGIAAADLARERKLVEVIHTIIKSTYSPKGLIIEYVGAYSAPDINMTGNGYYYGLYPLNYHCVDDNMVTEGETSTFFSINANLFEAEIYDTAQGERALAEGFNILSQIPFEKEGNWYFKEKEVGLGYDLKGKVSMWLITYDGKLPFAYVTKKEFLEKRKRSITAQKNMAAASRQDVLNNFDIEKGFKEKEFKNDPEKMQHYMKLDYIPGKERNEKLLADNEKEFKPAFDKIENQLRMPVAELNQQAIVKPDPNDYLSYLFTDSEDPSGKILIKPNPGYFNKKTLKSSPQFFWIYLKGAYEVPVTAQFMSDIMKAVDFATLKNMLGK